MNNVVVILLWLVLAALDLCAQSVAPNRRLNFLPAAGGGSCATTDTSLAHDTFLYGWESGDSGTWTSWVNVDVCTFNASFDTSSLTTGKATGQCNVGVEVAVNNTSGNESLYWDNGSAVTLSTTPTDFIFYIYVTTAMDASENFTIVSINTTTTGSGSVSVWVNLRNNGGTLEVQCEGGSSSSWVALTSNSWNKIAVAMAATAASSTLTVNDGSPVTFTRSGTQWRYFHYGAVQNHAANEACTYVLDLVAINTP